MADEMSSMEFDQENPLAIVIVDQPAKTAEPRFYEGMMFGLPRGWIVEVRPRKASSKYYGKVDQFFYEPETRRQFRSLKAVKKHLGLDRGQSSSKRKPKPAKEADQSKEKCQSKAANPSSENVDTKDKDGSRRTVAEEEKDFDKVAKRVKWQLIDGEQNSWNLYVKIPDSVKERWMGVFLKPEFYN